MKRCLTWIVCILCNQITNFSVDFSYLPPTFVTSFIQGMTQSSGSTKVPIWKLLLSFPHLPPCWSAQVQVLFLPSPSSKFPSLVPYYILPVPPLYPSAMWTLSIFLLPYKERGQPLFLVVVMDMRTLLPRKPQGTSQKQPAVSLYGNCESEPMASSDH